MLLKKTFKALGYQMEEITENSYKLLGDDNFIIDVEDRSAFIDMSDMCWYEEAIDDEDNYSDIMTAINRTNFIINYRVFYTIDKIANTIQLSTKLHFLFDDEIPELETYFYVCLRDFYSVRNTFVDMLQSIRNGEEFPVEGR